MDQFCTKSWTNIGELSSLDWERDQSGGPSLLVRVILYCKFLSVWQSDKTARCDGPDSVISYFHFLAFIEGTILLHHIYRPGQPYVESWLIHYTTLQWTTRKMYFSLRGGGKELYWWHEMMWSQPINQEISSLHRRNWCPCVRWAVTPSPALSHHHCLVTRRLTGWKPIIFRLSSCSITVVRPGDRERIIILINHDNLLLIVNWGRSPVISQATDNTNYQAFNGVLIIKLCN